MNSLQSWGRTSRSSPSFQGSAGDSKHRGHFSNTALWPLLSKARPALPPSPRAQKADPQPLAIANGSPERKQAWQGQGSPCQEQMPQGLDLPILLLISSAWAGKGES